VATNRDVTETEVLQMAETLGLSISAGDLPEVTHRFSALLEQLRKLDGLDLDAADPSAIFPKEAGA